MHTTFYAFHHTDSKDPDIHVLYQWRQATETHQAHTIHGDGMWLATSMVGLKNGHICKNLTKNGEPQRYSWEHRKRRRRISQFAKCLLQSLIPISPLHSSLSYKWLILQNDCHSLWQLPPLPLSPSLNKTPSAPPSSMRLKLFCLFGQSTNRLYLLLLCVAKLGHHCTPEICL